MDPGAGDVVDTLLGCAGCAQKITTGHSNPTHTYALGMGVLGARGAPQHPPLVALTEGTFL